MNIEALAKDNELQTRIYKYVISMTDYPFVCDLSAFLVCDIIGGSFVHGQVNGAYHCWTEKDDYIIDFTSVQFNPKFDLDKFHNIFSIEDKLKYISSLYTECIIRKDCTKIYCVHNTVMATIDPRIYNQGG